MIFILESCFGVLCHFSPTHRLIEFLKWVLPVVSRSWERRGPAGVSIVWRIGLVSLQEWFKVKRDYVVFQQ
jgi:hypothetical protein